MYVAGKPGNLEILTFVLFFFNERVDCIGTLTLTLFV